LSYSHGDFVLFVLFSIVKEKKHFELR